MSSKQKKVQKVSANKPVKTKKPSPSRFDTAKGLALLAVLVITAVIFIPTLSNGFVNWDDEPNILKNTNVETFDIKGIFTEPIIGGYNPPSTLTFAIEHSFVGYEPFLYHFDNLWLHLVCVIFVFLILQRLGLSTMGAAIGALLFGIHPMRVESVAWATERKDVLFGAFYLAAIWFYIRSLQEKEKKNRFLAVMLILHFFALLAKIQAVSLPLSMLAIDYLWGRPLRWSLIREKVPFFLLSLAVGLVGVYFLSENKSFDSSVGLNMAERLLVGAYAYIVYIAKFIFPFRMSPLYPYPHALPVDIYLAPLGVAAVLGLFWYSYKNDFRQAVFALVFFTVNVVFVLQILGAGQGYLADRFTYIPYLGFIFLVAYGFDWVKKNRPSMQSGVTIALGIYCCIFAFITFRQNAIWKDGETLWTHVLQYYDNTTTAWNNRGQIYRERQIYDKAMNDYTRSISLKPNIPALNSRGLVYFQLNQPDKAIADYTQAIAIDSTDKEIPEVLINRGAVYGATRQFDKALADLNRGLARDTANVLGYRNRYLAYIDTQNFPAALSDVNRYLQLKPGEPDAIFDRAIIKRALNDLPGSIPDFDAAIATAQPNAPNLGKFYAERSKTHRMMGNIPQAVADAQEAQRRGIAVPPEMLQ